MDGAADQECRPRPSAIEAEPVALTAAGSFDPAPRSCLVHACDAGWRDRHLEMMRWAPASLLRGRMVGDILSRVCIGQTPWASRTRRRAQREFIASLPPGHLVDHHARRSSRALATRLSLLSSKLKHRQQPTAATCLLTGTMCAFSATADQLRRNIAAQLRWRVATVGRGEG